MAASQPDYAADFLQTRPTEAHLRSEVCPKVGRKWREVCTYLNIQNTKVDMLVESNKHDIGEAFYRVLCSWRDSESATWEVLLSALRKADLNAQANQLLRQGESGALTAPDTDLQPPPLKKQAYNPHVQNTELHPQAAIKEQVYNEYRQFKLGEGPKANVEYVNLAVLEKSPSSKPDDIKDRMEVIRRFKRCGVRVAGKNMKSITPIDLLKKGNNRIQVVYGQAGSGKTTLLKQMCRALSCDEAESDFDQVLYFPLRDRSVSSAHDLQSLLRYYGSQNSRLDHTALAQSMVESNGRGLLMVFDGADEVKDLLKPSSRSVIQSILNGRILHEAHIIISSRPGACPSLQDHTACFYEVQGFDPTAITLYVNKYFKGSSAASRMLSQLDDRPDLLGGAYIPMNCFIFCSVFEQSSSFPATMAACYQAFVHQTIIRECRMKGRDLPLDPLLRYALLPEDIRCLLASLGALSFKGLCQVPPMFIFNEYGSTPNEPSIRSTFPQELLPLSAPIDEYLFKGLLRVHASKSGFQSMHSFSFPHGTQQEFFAALHLSNLEEDEQAQFWRNNLFNVSFSVVLRFFAGLTGLNSPQVAKEISKHAEAAEVGSTTHLIGDCSHDNPQLLFLCHTLHQSQNVPLTKTVMQRIPTSLGFNLSLSAFDTMAISYCLSQCSHLRLLNLSSPYCTLLSSQCLSHLKAVLQANTQCQLGDSLPLSCDHFSADDAQALSQIAGSLRKLHLWVSHTDCTALSTVCSLPEVTELMVTVLSDVKDDSEWPLVEKSLSKNKQLGNLLLSGCDTFLLNMGKALTENTSIWLLNIFRDEPLPDDVACAHGTGVAAMTQLMYLRMHDLSLPVLKSLPERTELLEKLTVWHPGVNWDSFSEDEWKEAEEAFASAKMREVELKFDHSSRQRSRAVHSVCEALAKNEFVRDISLLRVPEEMEESARRTLQTNSSVTHVHVSHELL